MRKNLLIFSLVMLSFGVASYASAHQPRYIRDEQIVVVKTPEVSQAFYGELKGQPAYYLIDLKEAGDLYLQILVPDLPGILKDKTVTVEYLESLGKLAVPFAKIDANLAVWQNYYEEYAGDNYWQGPEIKKMAEPGYYVVKVTSPDNSGKYVLVVGEKEEFSALEMAKAIIIIPQLKKNFFQEPVKQWFNGKIGKYFGIGLLIVLVVGFLFHRFRRIYK